MYCVECGTALPDVRDSSTVCSKCKTPVATWWDEATQSPRTHREVLPYAVSPQFSEKKTMSRRKNTQTVEERSFQTALICLEQHFEKKAGLGPKTMPEVKTMVKTALDQSLNKADVRYEVLGSPLFLPKILSIN
jgi:palmitoyltransferase